MCYHCGVIVLSQKERDQNDCVIFIHCPCHPFSTVYKLVTVLISTTFLTVLFVQSSMAMT